MNQSPNEMKWYKWVIALCILVLAIVVFNSCDCNYHLKRAELKCGKKVIQDTILVHDTLKVPEVKVDTVVTWMGLTDTVYINKDRFHLKLIRKDSLVYLEGKCDSLVVYRKIKVPYEKVILDPEVYKTWWFWIAVAIILGILYLVRRK